jgi:hypothetical protein
LGLEGQEVLLGFELLEQLFLAGMVDLQFVFKQN